MLPLLAMLLHEEEKREKRKEEREGKKKKEKKEIRKKFKPEKILWRKIKYNLWSWFKIIFVKGKID
jgi:hypothetical protein